MRIVLSYIIAPVFFLAGMICHGQDYSFRHLTSEDGMPSNYAFSILKDSQGFVWIGTRDGLCRYDGYNLKVFQNEPRDSTSLSDNHIVSMRSLAEDKNGNVWIGTLHGLNRFDRITESFRRFYHDPNDPGSVNNNRIECIYSDRLNELWIGTPGRRGLNRFDAASGKFVSFEISPEMTERNVFTITAIYEDRSGNFWIGTNNGIFQFDRENGAYIRTEFTYDRLQTTEAVHVMAIYEDSDSILYIGSQNGFFTLDRQNGTMLPFEPFYAESNDFRGLDILEDPKNPKQLWITEWYLYIFDKKNHSLAELKNDPTDPLTIRGNILSAIYCDDSNIIWLPCEFGVNILMPTIDRIPKHREFAEKYSDAMSFMEDSQGNKWIGTSTCLLHCDENLKVIKKYDSFPLDPKNKVFRGDIWAICEDSDHNIWVGTEFDGLYLRRAGREEFVRCKLFSDYSSNSPVFIWDILEDSRGTIWLSTFPNGLYYKVKSAPNLTEFNNSSLVQASRFMMIDDIFEDRSGNLWFATRGGGLKKQSIDLKDSVSLDQYAIDAKNIGSISSNWIRAVCQDKNGNLWLASEDGLILFEQDKTAFKCFRNEKEKGSNMILNLLCDDQGVLWLTTESGLYRFDPRKIDNNGSNQLLFKHILPFNDILPYKIFKSKDGKIFLGGSYKSGKGYYYFHPDSLEENTKSPDIALVDFRIRNEEVKLDTSITIKKMIRLKHRQNFFSFEFTSLDYTDPETNEYAYKLDGLDEDWIYSGNRRYANYTGVPPGDYIFHVKGSNSDGYWNDTGATIYLTILKPPWKTWWATVLYILLILGILFSIAWYYIKRQQLRNALEIEHFQKEKLSEIDKMKSRFFANISHEFRTPLTLILGPLEKLRSISTEKQFLEELNMMQRNAIRLRRLIDELLDLSKLEARQMKLNAEEVNIVTLVRGYFRSFNSAARQKGIELSFHSDQPVIHAYIDREKMEKILFNLVSNALKFTPDGGVIKIEVGQLDSLTIGQNVNYAPTLLANFQLPTAQLCYIQVSDIGPGISPEHLPHIFDRFYQADNSDSQFQEGTGIGLALVKELVELHHGRINVESHAGKGTTFTIWLPMGKEHLKPEEMVIVKQSVATSRQLDQEIEIQVPVAETWKTESTTFGGTIRGKSGKPLILLVEDNADMRHYIRSFLQGQYQVVEAQDGLQGMKLAFHRIPDLVISDVMMPGLDGYELCRNLRTDERTSHVPVILLTAKSELENKLEGYETGADDFITKPFQPTELMARVRNLIWQRQQLREIFKKEFEHISLRPETSMSALDVQFMEKARSVVGKNLSNPDFDIVQFSSMMNMSRVQLHRKLIGLFNMSASAFIRVSRLNAAARLLESKSGNIAQIAYEVGFNNLSYFSRCFQKQFGIKPSEYLTHLK